MSTPRFKKDKEIIADYESQVKARLHAGQTPRQLKPAVPVHHEYSHGGFGSQPSRTVSLLWNTTYHVPPIHPQIQ
ncbi:unnamed protein product [Knipowitschia caucasica]